MLKIKLLFLVALLALACGQSSQKQDTSDSVQVRVDFSGSDRQKSGQTENVSEVILEIWDDGFYAPDPFRLELKNGIWSTELYGLPKKSVLYWRASAYSSESVLKYQGDITTNPNQDLSRVELALSEINEQQNHPPVILTLYGHKKLHTNESADFSITAVDSDNDELEITWTFSDQDSSMTSASNVFNYQSSNYVGLIDGMVEVSDGVNKTKLAFQFNVTPNLKEDIKLEFIPISVAITDPISGNSLNDLKVRVAGRDANRVKNIFDESIEILEHVNGACQLYCEPLFGSEFWQFRLIFEKEGYLFTSREIFIYDDTPVKVSVAMIEKKSKGHDKVDIYRTKVGSESGRLVGGLTLGSNTTREVSGNVVSGGIEMVCPDGVVMLDQSGEPVEGLVDVSVSYHNPLDEDALTHFPGGFDAIIEGESDGVFISGGFTAIEFENQNGVKVKSFSDPIQVKLNLDSSIINPITQSPIKNGDVIPIWSYSYPEANWESETQGEIVGPDENEQYEVCFEVQHLSYWNLDWKDDKVISGINLNVVDASGNYVDFNYKLKLKRQGGGFARSKVIQGDGLPLEFQRIIGDQHYSLIACDPLDDTVLLGQLDTYLDFSAQKFIPDTLVINKPEVAQIKVNISYCDLSAPDDEISPSSSTIIFYNTTGQLIYHLTTDNSGNVNVDFPKNTERVNYSVYNLYTEIWEEGELIIDDETEKEIKLKFDSELLYLDPPSLMSADFTDFKVNTCLGEVAFAKNYHIYYQSTPGVTKSSSRISSSVFKNSFENNSSELYLRFSVSNRYGESELSDEVNLSLEISPPATPVLNGYPDDQRNVLWWDKNPIAQEYKLYRSSSSNVLDAVLIYEDDELFYLDKTIENFQPYYYWLVATNVAGESDFSLPIELEARVKLPTKILDLDFNSQYQKNILSWGEVWNVDYYELEWESSSNQLSGNTIQFSTHWNHFLPEVEVSYRYRIRGVNSAGAGHFSDWLEIEANVNPKTIIRINPNAAPGGDGSSWELAYQKLSDVYAWGLEDVEVWLIEGDHFLEYRSGYLSVLDRLTRIDYYGGFIGNELERGRPDSRGMSKMNGEYGIWISSCQDIIFENIQFDINVYNSLDVSYNNNLLFSACQFTVKSGYISSSYPISNYNSSALIFDNCQFLTEDIELSNYFFYSRESDLSVRNCQLTDVPLFFEKSSISLVDCDLSKKDSFYEYIYGYKSNIDLLRCSSNTINNGYQLTINDCNFYASQSEFNHFNFSSYNSDGIKFDHCELKLAGQSFNGGSSIDVRGSELIEFVDSKLINVDTSGYSYDQFHNSVVRYVDSELINISLNFYEESVAEFSNSTIRFKQYDYIYIYESFLYGENSNFFSDEFVGISIYRSHCSLENVEMKNVNFDNYQIDSCFFDFNQVHFSTDGFTSLNFEKCEVNFNHSVCSNIYYNFFDSEVDFLRSEFDNSGLYFDGSEVTADGLIVTDHPWWMYIDETNINAVNSIFKNVDLWVSPSESHQRKLDFFHCHWLDSSTINVEENNHLTIKNSILNSSYFVQNATGNILISESLFPAAHSEFQELVLERNLIGTPTFLDSTSLEGLDGKLFTEDDGLQLLENSIGVGAGNLILDTEFDILGKQRSIFPNLGPYESPY